ncbi:MAG: TraR/DksA family transcriptional regulator [Gammaproteobacteria bacterium]
MADEADIANDLIANEVSSVLNRLRRDTVIKVGPKECVECEEAIPVARRQLGFKHCVECAEKIERRKSLFAD